MITDVLLNLVTYILNFLIGLLPATPSTALSGLPAMGSFLGQVIGVSKAFVPWSDFFLMIGILLAITGVRIVMQVINLLWP